MTKRLVLRSAAQADILERFAYLADQGSVETAERFLDAVRAALERVLEMPGIGSPRSLGIRRLQGLRTWPIPGFEAVRLYYVETGDTIRVIRILHGMQDVSAILERDGTD